MSQTEAASYGYQMDRARAGMPADKSNQSYRETFSAGEAIDFGAALKRNADSANKTKKIAENIEANTDPFIGVAMFTHSIPQSWDPRSTPSSEGSQYKANDVVTIIRNGAVWVDVDGEVEWGEAAYYDALLGKFTAAEQDSETNSTIGPVGEFKTYAADGGLAVVHLMLGAGSI